MSSQTSTYPNQDKYLVKKFPNEIKGISSWRQNFILNSQFHPI